MRDDRFPRPRDRDDRYPAFYRDDYPSSSNGPRPAPPPRQEVDRPPLSGKAKDDSKPSTPTDPYPPARYNDWRERRYRDDDRRRDFDRRGRDGYSRYDGPPGGYGPPPPTGYGPYYGGDSYRPGSNRDREPASPGAYYYDRDTRDRFDERDYYRPIARGGSMDMDRYRRPTRPGNAWRSDSRDFDRDGRPSYSSGMHRDDDRQDSLKPSDDIDMDRTQDNKLMSMNTKEGSSSGSLRPSPSSVPKRTPLNIDVTRSQPSPIDDNASSPMSLSTPASSQSTLSLVFPTTSQGLPSSRTASASPPLAPAITTAPSRPSPTTSIALPSAFQPPPVTKPTEIIVKEESQPGPAPIGEPAPPEDDQPPTMSQQQIVSRIDEIENDISMYEELLEQATKREQEAHLQQRPPTRQSSVEAKDDEDDMDDVDDQEQEQAKQEALQVISQDGQPMTDIQNLSEDDGLLVRRRPQLLIEQIRNHDHDHESLPQTILDENRALAKENAGLLYGWQGCDDDRWDDEAAWCKPLYSHLDEYPCVQENKRLLRQQRQKVAAYLAGTHRRHAKKERRLKREYKAIYESWKTKNLTIDRIHDQERRRHPSGGGYRSRRGPSSTSTTSASTFLSPSAPTSTTTTITATAASDDLADYVDGVIFTGNNDSALRFGDGDGAATPYGKGAWTSDAVRSEAELLEIIQSLENAEMRNPELRAAKTTATIPTMILDAKERALTYNDRSGLVENPLVYYHTGQETEDVWNQQEMTAFMESYMQYPKQFGKIAAAIKTKTASQCVLFYYRKKTKIDFKNLLRRGRRGKKKKDRVALALRRATDGTASPRRAKSKGSALMADIGKAQVSRKAKEKQVERETSPDLGLPALTTTSSGRKTAKRPASTTSLALPATTSPSSSASSGLKDTDLASTSTSAAATPPPAKRKATAAAKRANKGRSPRPSSSSSTSAAATPNLAQLNTTDDDVTTLTKTWSDQEKELATDAFRAHGTDFVRVASLLGSKNEGQCRNFYFNHKRKFGPDIFGEQYDDDGNLILSAPSKVPRPTQTVSLKEEEKDAAATLAGMFQMGAAASPVSEASPPSSSPSRQRARTISGMTDQSDEWDDDKPRALPAAASSATPPIKRGANSSYWTVAEKQDFMQSLRRHGRDWAKIASDMKSKTLIQVRNFYTNNEEKLHLDRVLQERALDQQHGPASGRAAPVLPQQHTPPPPPPPPSRSQPMPPMGTAFDSPNVHPHPHHPHQQTPPPPAYPAAAAAAAAVPPAMYGAPPAAVDSPHAVYGPQPGYFPTYNDRPPRYPYGQPQDHPSHRPSAPTMPPHADPYHRARPPPKESQQGVTRVSDLLNSTEEPTNTGSKNSWETWFGA
ncbi:hypothetical protein DM01DRAFT_1337608 [Hesseltinella vesiculosa]|uniref:SANT domain-containing protein n=1 Tax=Hesseltinella vesiculosa TaxID=101127 RepID=A0A1X2GD42_9FUNG|nr:hypothetical protein DM01DRAFT_1337608 [Hesseltinella vesiculosa]